MIWTPSDEKMVAKFVYGRRGATSRGFQSRPSGLSLAGGHLAASIPAISIVVNPLDLVTGTPVFS